MDWNNTVDCSPTQKRKLGFRISHHGTHHIKHSLLFLWVSMTDKLKMYDVISAPQTGNWCMISISVSQPFSPSADISASSSFNCGRFCDIHRFTQTGTCVFYMVAHSHVPTVWHSAIWEEFVLHLYSIFVVYSMLISTETHRTEWD